MWDIDQRLPRRQEVILRPVMSKVSGDIHIDGRIEGLQQRITRSPTHRHPAHRRIHITRDADAVLGRRKNRRQTITKFSNSGCLQEVTYATGADLLTGGIDRRGGAEAAGLREGIRDTGARVIGVRVCAIQRDPVADECVHDAPFRGGGRHRMNAVQEQRVMGHDHVGPHGQRLVHHRQHRVHREQHMLDSRRGIPTHQSDGVPVRRQLGWITLLESRDGLLHRGGHRRRLPSGLTCHHHR